MELSFVELNALAVTLSDTIFRLEKEEKQAVLAKKKDRVTKLRTDLKDWRNLRAKVREAREAARINGSMVSRRV